MTDPKCWLILCTNKDGETWWHPTLPADTRSSAETMIQIVKDGAFWPKLLPKMEPVEMVRK